MGSRGLTLRPNYDLPVPREPDSWGRDGQEEIFPPGTTLELRRYRSHKASWDHDHCIFCWAKLMDPDLSEDSRRAVKRNPEILTSGYTSGPVGGEWVCPNCFDEFSERFGWRPASS